MSLTTKSKKFTCLTAGLLDCGERLLDSSMGDCIMYQKARARVM